MKKNSETVLTGYDSDHTNIPVDSGMSLTSDYGICPAE